jgi:2-polyprenyl-3-methyl-5-hydroxy-6-metoxy-1,4-benzoquinol methylase
MEHMVKAVFQKGLKKLYRRYEHAPVNLMERLVIYLRLRFSSYDEIEKHVPPSGEILDLACGFGMLSAYLALSSEARQVKGVDISQRRIGVAKSVSAQISNVTFQCGDVLQYPLGECHCILLIDALHYFVPSVQNELLRRCHESIAPGGRLLVRDPDRDRDLRHLVTRLHETVMTKSGFTEGDMLCFRSFAELGDYLQGLGFIVNALPMWHGTPFADTLLICKKH